MRRFLTLVLLLCLAIPAGISISGCYRNPAGNYCNGEGYGLKDDDVASVTLQPQTAGISLAFGQTKQLGSPAAYTCKGGGAVVNTTQYTYGTSNNQLVDISPTGNICAGTWNRNSGGGIPNYTICNFPNPLPATNGLPYQTAFVTASISSVTSNPVEVYIHQQVTSVSLVGPQQCLSQTATAQLDSQACFSSGGQQYLLCAPSSVTSASSPSLACPLAPGSALASIPSCGNSIGTFNYAVASSNIATINTDTNQITANLPGTTAITASIAGSGSSAGYFSTCPPKSINITLANGKTTGSVTLGVQQNLTTTVTDTNGNSITGLALDYQSTNPIDITTASAGTIYAAYPGVASITAVCQPASCNPSPINELGLNGTGLSITSNPVTISTPGTDSEYVWFGAPGQSQYFAPVEVLSGTVGSTVRLPYVPNSMVMDQLGENLYFGSARELMIYSATSNSISKQDPNAPGVVLAATPSMAAQPPVLSPGQPAPLPAIRNDPFHGPFTVPDRNNQRPLSTGPGPEKGRSVNIPYFVEHLISHSPSHPSHTSHAFSTHQSPGIHEGHDHALHRPGHCRVGAQFMSPIEQCIHALPHRHPQLRQIVE